MTNPYLIQGILDLIIGGAELLLAVYFFITHSGSRLRQFYAAFVLGVAVWVITNGLFCVLPLDSQFDLIHRTIFWGAVIIASSFLMVSWFFPFATREMTWKTYAIILIPFLIFTVLFYFTNFIISYPTISVKGVVESTYGELYPLFGAWFLFYWTWGVVNLVRKWKITTGIHRWMLKYFLIGVFGSSIVGVFTNLILPLFFGIQNWGWLGPMASIIWLGFTSYIIRGSS